MLQEALTALQLENIKTPLLTGTKFASYSLSYQLPGKFEQLGVVWTEDSNMNTFFYVMEACRKELLKNSSLTLSLIRAESLGDSKNKGYKKYVEIFTGSRHYRIAPNLSSVHYLATYYSLVKDAREGDLVIGGKTIGLKKLQETIRELNSLHDCSLLEDLGAIDSHNEHGINEQNSKDKQGKQVKEHTKEVKLSKELIEAKQFILNLIQTQQLMGKAALIDNVSSQFPKVISSQIERLIQQLCQEKRVELIDPDGKPESQLIYLLTK
jgi:hypothetical protein